MTFAHGSKSYSGGLVVAYALAAAICWASASVLQQRAAASEPDTGSLGPSLIVRLAHHRAWLVGNGADAIAYLFQFLALRRGSLALVQPLLVTSMLFALPVSARLGHRRL